MFFDLERLSSDVCHKLMTSTVVPRPIAWITTLNEDGSVNAGPFSFFNIVCEEPPLLAVGIGTGERFAGDTKDTCANILRGSDFVINLVDHANARKMVRTAVDLPSGQSELAFADLQVKPSSKVAAPLIVGAPVSFECELFQSIDLGGSRTLVLGRIVGLHIVDDAVINAERGHVDTPALDLIARMHGNGWYTRMTDWFQEVTPR